MPDLLGYNANKHFFTVELKVTKGKKIKFSPHQISFHVTHPENTFILVQTLGPRSTNRFQLYPGSGILALEASGRDLEPFCLGLDAIRDFLYQLGAWRLELGACCFGRPGRDPCCLELEACRLKLGAFFSQLLELHNISGDTRSLVLAVWYIFNFRIPAISTIFALIALLCTGTCCARCHYGASIWPAGRCCLVHHRRAEPDHQVAWRAVEMVLNPCFTGWHPVTLRRRQPAYFINFI